MILQLEAESLELLELSQGGERDEEEYEEEEEEKVKPISPMIDWKLSTPSWKLEISVWENSLQEAKAAALELFEKSLRALKA